MIKFRNYLTKNILNVFITGLLVVILVINIIFSFFNNQFINDAKDHLNESFIANLDHLYLEYDKDMYKLKKYITHYVHTNNVNVAVYKDGELLIGDDIDVDKDELYDLYSYQVAVDRDTSILDNINAEYVLLINIISVILFIILVIITKLTADKISYKISRELTVVTDEIEKIIDGNYKEVSDGHIAEIKKIDNTLKYLNDKLNSLSVERKELIDDITHEIKTPLTVIRSHIEGIKDGLYSIETSSTILINEIKRIDDLVTKINNLTEQKNKKEIDLSQVLLNTIELFKAIFIENNIGLKTNVEEGIYIQGNAEHFKQIFVNLLSNIQKYSVGNKEVEIKLINNEKIIIEFENDSEEINEDELNKLFDRGFKAKNSTEGKGSGFGLNIVKNLVEYNDGEITVTHKNNKTNMRIVL